MTPQILNWLAHLPIANLGKVLEIGSWNINGTPRTPLIAKASSWLGIDLFPGADVDIVVDSKEYLNYTNFGHYDTVIACEVYEHDPKFWLTNDAVKRILAPGGLYIITSPTIDFPIHEGWDDRSFGGDFYRFTESALRSLFGEEMEIIEVTTVGDSAWNHCVCGCARMVKNQQL